MPCYHPLSAWKTSHGEVIFVDRGNGDRIDLPCGRCIGCRLERSRQWATRIMFEAQFHKENSFLTLTYDDQHLPSPPSLKYDDFQRFMKRLRFKLGSKVRFFVCGEYGEQNLRPHYHACLFGYSFPDRVLWSNSPSGFPLYRSAELESLWPLGFTSVAELSFESAAYVARYSLKKVTGDLADAHYTALDASTGELYKRTPEFARMSLKPGIGGNWFDKYSGDLAGDYVVINGHRCKPPRYFDKLFKRLDPLDFAEVQARREFDAYKRRGDNTDSRLAVRERVQRAALMRLSPRGDL